MIYTLENTLYAGRKIDVYLDGKLVSKANYVDTEKGIVCRYCTDESGRPILLNGHLKSEKLTGNVQVVER